MRRLLYVGDFGATGFGTVSNGLLSYLSSTNKYDILQIGINYNDIKPANVPWRVVPAGFHYPIRKRVFDTADPYGFTKTQSYVQSFDPDIVFINNDFTIIGDYLQENGKPTPLAEHRSQKVAYAPLDSFPFPPRFAEIGKQFNKVIAYSGWEYSLMIQTDPSYEGTPIMYHGVDTSVFKPMDKREAKRKLRRIFREYAKSRKVKVPDFEEKYIVLFVGTNQWRKDIPALFKAFHDFNDVASDAFLLPLTSMLPMSPTHGGWALYNLRDLTGVRNSTILQDANVFTSEQLNIIYNAADVLAYPTRGEGFGLPSLEAMATKTPVIATKFGPQYELHADGRGYFIDVLDYEPGMPGSWTFFAKPSHMSLLEQMLHVYHNRDEAAETAERAYQYAIEHTWESKGKQLDGILDQCQPVSNKVSPSPSIQKRRKKT